MITFDTLLSHATDYPARWTFLGSPEAARQIPQTHQDQIFFLDGEATEFLWNYIHSSRMVTGPLFEPFNERYFRTVLPFALTEDCDAAIRKWLYAKPVPFGKMVYMTESRREQAVALTWKMVIKYWAGIFPADLILFDASLNWGLYGCHEDMLFFGQDKIYDKEYEFEKTDALHELKQRFFRKDDPDIDPQEKQAAILAFKAKYGVDRIG